MKEPEVEAQGLRTLESPEKQPYVSRLSGAGSLRSELEALLAQASPQSGLGDYRCLVVHNNAAGKRSAAMRTKVWKELKVRYLLDPFFAEFRAFRDVFCRTSDPSERGLIEFLMMARTDRLFREVVQELVSPHLAESGTAISLDTVRTKVEAIGRGAQRSWSVTVVDGISVHLLSSCKDFGLLSGGVPKRTVSVKPGPAVAAFAIRLARLEGLGDRRALESRWFALLGLDLAGVLELMDRAARIGALRFRFQADVAEISLPEAAEVGS